MKATLPRWSLNRVKFLLAGTNHRLTGHGNGHVLQVRIDGRWQTISSYRNVKAVFSCPVLIHVLLDISTHEQDAKELLDILMARACENILS